MTWDTRPVVAVAMMLCPWSSSLFHEPGLTVAGGCNPPAERLASPGDRWVSPTRRDPLPPSWNRLLLKRGRGADDVGQLAGNLSLPGAIVLSCERLDEVVGVPGRRAHGDHAGDLLAHGGV